MPRAETPARSGTVARARPWLVQPLILVLAVAASGALSAATVEWFTLRGTATVLWWPVAGLALALVVRLPRAWWPAVLIGMGVGIFFVTQHSGTMASAVSFTIVNIAEVALGAHLLVGRGSERRLGTRRDGVRFALALAAALAAGAVVIAVRAMVLPGVVPWTSAVSSYLVRHIIGLLIVAPLMLPRGVGLARRHWHEAEFVAILAATVALGLWGFFAPSAPGRAFTLLLPVVWAGARVGPARTAAVTILAASLASSGAARQRGPFATIDNSLEQLWQVQIFLAALALTALLLVLISRHREHLAAQARAGEETLRRAIRDSLVPMYSILLDPEHLGEIRDANTALTSMLGYGRGELEGEFCGILGARDFADRLALLDTYLENLRDGVIGSYREESQFIKANGELLWVETNVSRVNPVTGPPFALVHVHDLTQRQQNKQMLEQMALYDALTGVANRTLLFRRLNEELATVVGTDRTVGLLYLDLNDFKTINDTLGHAAGDAVLIESARRFSAAVRPGDTVARLGGDEFAVLCASIRSLVDLQQIADRIRGGLRIPLALPGGEKITVGVSIGMAVADGLEDPDHLMRVADASMYADKHAMRGKEAPAR